MRRSFEPALFVSGIVFNLGALEHANVETLIVARSCLPLLTSVLDYLFLGRQARTRLRAALSHGALGNE